jgi:hypothetical protein
MLSAWLGTMVANRRAGGMKTWCTTALASGQQRGVCSRARSLSTLPPNTFRKSARPVATTQRPQAELVSKAGGRMDNDNANVSINIRAHGGIRIRLELR